VEGMQEAPGAAASKDAVKLKLVGNEIEITVNFTVNLN